MLAAILIAVEVTLRSTRMGAISAGTELSSYALATAATWSLAFVIFERGHVRVDILVRRLPTLLRSSADILSLLSLAIVGLVLTLGAWEMFGTSLRLSARSNTTLGIPLAWPHGFWAVGLGWFTFVAGFRTLEALHGFWRQDFAMVDRVCASPSHEDEVEEAISETTGRLHSGDTK